MNVKILLLFFLGMIGFNVNAQSNPKNPTVTGVKGGLNLSNLSAGKNTQEMKPAFHVGGFVEMPLSYYKKVALQIELLYSNQGYKGKEFEVRDEITNKVIGKNKLEDVSLHYLNVPIMIKYYIKDNIAVEVGPQIGFLMGASGSYDLYKFYESRQYFMNFSSEIERELDVNGYISSDYKKYYDKVDYGVSFGLSYNFENGIFVSGRYYLGLKDVYKADNKYSKILIPEGSPEFVINEINKLNSELEFKEAKNTLIQFSVGYRF
ncbi:porin family protein [Flavobacterium sp. I3-2]|uniref:porin family protein n=1 Tax=Flavobacterium sp. I3-2 TaxID=2748319 RepID=UPI0015AD77C7|nr:porin family protein [Flavobacterium sp. I3-2]